MAAILWPPECGFWYADNNDNLASSTIENCTAFDRGNIDNLAGRPLNSTSVSEKPYAFAASLAADLAETQHRDSAFQPYLLPDHSLMLDNSILEESCALADLRKDLDCIPTQEYNLLDEFSCTRPLDFALPSPNTSHSNYDSMPTPIASVVDSASTGVPAPDTSKCLTPALSPSQARDAGSSGISMDYFDNDDQRWHATQSRSRVADRSFLYGVLTTRIFCRPSCASRRPSRRHVRFFPFPGAIEAAEQAKFRPCKRCIPEAFGAKSSSVLKICRVLRTIIAETFNKEGSCGKEALKLDSLAKLAGFSTFHFHRTFKATTQIAPGDFIHACRALALQDTLRNDLQRDLRMRADALAVIENSSCWSPRTAKKALGGISPEDFASNTYSRLFEYCYAETPCGLLCVVFSGTKHHAETNVHAAFFAQEGEPLCSRFATAALSGKYEHRLQECVDQLERAAKDWDTELPADVLPVLWRARVWLKFLRD